MTPLAHVASPLARPRTAGQTPAGGDPGRRSLGRLAERVSSPKSPLGATLPIQVSQEVLPLGEHKGWSPGDRQTYLLHDAPFLVHGSQVA